MVLLNFSLNTFNLNFICFNHTAMGLTKSSSWIFRFKLGNAIVQSSGTPNMHWYAIERADYAALHCYIMLMQIRSMWDWSCETFCKNCHLISMQVMLAGGCGCWSRWSHKSILFSLNCHSQPPWLGGGEAVNNIQWPPHLTHSHRNVPGTPLFYPYLNIFLGREPILWWIKR